MIELRKRVLSTGFVVLEFRQNPYNSSSKGGIFDTDWSDWQMVPYVDEEGNPLEGIQEHTG